MRPEEQPSTQMIRLIAEEQRRFIDLLIDPPAPVPAMERARCAHAVMIRLE